MVIIHVFDISPPLPSNLQIFTLNITLPPLRHKIKPNTLKMVEIELSPRAVTGKLGFQGQFPNTTFAQLSSFVLKMKKKIISRNITPAQTQNQPTHPQHGGLWCFPLDLLPSFRFHGQFSNTTLAQLGSFILKMKEKPIPPKLTPTETQNQTKHPQLRGLWCYPFGKIRNFRFHGQFPNTPLAQLGSFMLKMKKTIPRNLTPAQTQNQTKNPQHCGLWCVPLDITHNF